APHLLLFSSPPPPPPTSTLFPYTTLFRSLLEHPGHRQQHRGLERPQLNGYPPQVVEVSDPDPVAERRHLHHPGQDVGERQEEQRSEEHTSELQSRENLVCRLLLEKKKKER